MVKQRLDVLMVQRGIVESRNLAQRLIMAGEVRVDGEQEIKSSSQFAEDVQITITQKPRYVSRGGEKLEAALEAFGLEDLDERICLDMGSSTGGFTDCLLQHGASRIYAVDVGHGILHWKIRQDSRVVVMEKTNARYLKDLPESIDLVTIDTSFISAKVLLPVARRLLGKDGKIILLVKPQFEAGRKETARGEGVIKDPSIHEKVLLDIIDFARNIRLFPEGLIPSPLLGPKGNREFLLYLGMEKKEPSDPGVLIGKVLKLDT
jgi:23S rRNA (cytidine1920-2'-O)/16S rRNA (cytidine1409-2'-O)-methyltransferase